MTFGKDYLIQILLGIILTVAGTILAFVSSIETPVDISENYAILWVGVLNLLWLIPYLVVFNKRKKPLIITISIFCIFWIPFVLMNFYRPSFNSKEWKSAINFNRTYGGHPAHSEGKMVSDIINSKILINRNIGEIESLLGPYHFTQHLSGDSALFYFYSSKNPFEGCDKIYIQLKDGVCYEAGFSGCD